VTEEVYKVCRLLGDYDYYWAAAAYAAVTGNLYAAVRHFREGHNTVSDLKILYDFVAVDESDWGRDLQHSLRFLKGLVVSDQELTAWRKDHAEAERRR